MTVKGTNQKYTVKQLKKKAQSFAAVEVTGAANVTYKGKAVNKKSKKALKFNAKTGKIKVKKKTKKGTYKMKVTVTTKGDANHAASTVTKTVIVKVTKK